jgi:hypothetical protein
MNPKSLAALLASTLALPIMADPISATSGANEKDELLKLRQDIAKEREELLNLKNTTSNLIDVFVQQGLLDKAKAETLLKAAKATGGTASGKPSADVPGRIRVTHVPEFVKEEIRQEVMAGLQDKVTQQVKAEAKQEQWGVPAALPEWLGHIKIVGDARLRMQEDMFGDDNQKRAYLDYLAINRDGGTLAAYNKNEQYLNTTEDRLRLRERFRLGLEAQITDGLKAVMRLSTTNQFSPVSSNQTLGNTGQSFQVAMDRAFIEYDFLDSQQHNLFSFYGGRIANPWLSTEMQFSPDLGFEGLVGTFRLHAQQHNPGSG